ncbi:hypothetical protein AAFO92_01060 [Roseovarius sp. CAU 1744]|uniref:hypothetical protein n=1 Tax=Roseovarius sp. CAU 1744 TaxID=3140368 RepID=UPI00325B1DA3
MTDALYRAELQKMAALSAKEADLRHKLAELDALRSTNRSLPPGQLTVVRQIGADVLWQGWVSRTRETLNLELAQILAQKEYMKSELQRAYGKQMAAAAMRDKARNKASQDRAKRFWQAQDDLQVLKSSRD